jgi:hypothetical protein
VRASSAIIEHLQAINRSGSIGCVPWRSSRVAAGYSLELVQDRARQQPQTAFAFSADKLCAATAKQSI